MMPHDSAAERAVLGACMESTAAYRTAAAVLTDGDWFEERHATIWAAVGYLVDIGAQADPTLVLDRVRELGQLSHVGGGLSGAAYLHEVYSSAPIALQIGEHARIVADCATRRRLLRAAQQIVQRAEAGVGEVGDLLESAASAVSAARDQRAGVEVLTSTVDEFLHATPEHVDWVVPGLLARGDRLVLTGSGGLGKSTVLRQVAVCAAAGIDPLDWAAGEGFDPVRVTLIDCENADHQLKTALFPMLREARAVGRPVEDRLRIGGHGNSLDLLDTSSALSLLRTIEHDRPDLVYIGPVYKLHNDDPDKESVIKRVTHVLDQIRETGAAVVTEAHHTKAAKGGGSLEPSGSNLWTWWPEMGRGMRLDPDSDTTVRRCALERWRIDRVQRNIPDWIEHGGRWPWARCAPNPYYGMAVA